MFLKSFEHTPKINEFIINKLRRIIFEQKLSKKKILNRMS